MADHPHTIDRWDDATGENLIEQIATVGDYLVALATYRAAVKRWPKDKIAIGQLSPGDRLNEKWAPVGSERARASRINFQPYVRSRRSRRGRLEVRRVARKRD